MLFTPPVNRMDRYDLATGDILVRSAMSQKANAMLARFNVNNITYGWQTVNQSCHSPQINIKIYMNKWLAVCNVTMATAWSRKLNGEWDVILFALEGKCTLCSLCVTVTTLWCSEDKALKDWWTALSVGNQYTCPCPTSWFWPVLAVLHCSGWGISFEGVLHEIHTMGSL